MRVDRIFEGGTLLTMDPARPRATALAVVGGRIVAMGDGDELRRHLVADRVVSLQDRTVVPGFHDAHNHMPSFGMGLADVPLSSPPVARVEDILHAVKARAASQPAGSWVIGSGYDQNKLAEGRHPRASELDAVAPDHLVWLRHNSGHMCVVGGHVLDAIGIDSGRGAGGRRGRARWDGSSHRPPPGAGASPRPRAGLSLSAGRAGRGHRAREQRALPWRGTPRAYQEAGVGGGLVARSPVELSAWQEARVGRSASACGPR